MDRLERITEKVMGCWAPMMGGEEGGGDAPCVRTDQSEQADATRDDEPEPHKTRVFED